MALSQYEADADVLERDLACLGLTLLGRMDKCQCSVCQTLDRRFVADVLAENEDGYPVLVAHRHQPSFNFDTLTIREINDHGSSKIEAWKIATGRSLATIHIQSYSNHLIWITGDALAVALRSQEWQDCTHPPRNTGSSGQVFVIVCPSCSDAIRVDL